ncbi:hypothetical protein CCHR01_19083 [Colletotrichum chrysophilum]|uniref:Uncharacterized protein n=1 Tax=Colletotrichum chrysophilum TaxID=1836956 RepID=A0AAD9A3B2_9PEZI|nr:hypothetical protein CCHR01_19083 [Colletotrichum chrysophilum]
METRPSGPMTPFPVDPRLGRECSRKWMQLVLAFRVIDLDRVTITRGKFCWLQTALLL